MKFLYALLSALGDAKSLSRSPSAYGRRQLRKSGHRALARTMRRSKWLRG